MSGQPGADTADILIVDDTLANLRLLSELLMGNGYHVRTVTSGVRALESARAVPPNLILLDIRMPEMDGCEVCEQLKADERTRHVPVIFISALDEIEEKVRAFKVGGVDYITKPFQVEEVLVRVETHLTLRRLQQRLEVANQRFERELLLAGDVQASLLPSELPQLPGWEFAAFIQPARETSGDFYDVFQLPGGRLGLLVADVVDKGAAAALLMAISWNVIDTCASEHPNSPQDVFAAANQRMLQRLEGRMFLTAFYGILDPEQGRLVYCNAGHSPPYRISASGGETTRLLRTGPPLGLLDEADWQTQTLQIQPGDALLLYTDGVTDAERSDGAFYGSQRLEASLQAQASNTATQIRDALLADIQSFAAGAPQYDDIVLMVVKRLG
ncbi:MAG: SpoIIE family protein phosphatase [Anaerolineales bacterium]